MSRNFGGYSTAAEAEGDGPDWGVGEQF